MAVERTLISWKLNAPTREELRRSVLLKWADEKRGSKDAPERYRYDVESFGPGGAVYLHRPAYLNKGCDFVVHCEPPILRDDGKKYKNPRHQDLLLELKSIAAEIPGGKQLVLDAVEAIWECSDPDTVYAPFATLHINDTLKMRVDRALKVAKWLFIEQDITDWNTSGRDMLMNSINRAFGL